MKFSVSIDIDLPRDDVIALFDNPENLPKWQKGLQSFEPISGTPGEPGARSRLVFQMGDRRIEMTETVTKRNLPDEFNGTYDTEGVFSVVNNRFESVGPNKTKWVSENEIRFSGYMKVLGLLMKGTFSKHSLQFMQDFKAFAERGVDVRQSTAT
jgi:hypothetical protein